MLPLCGKFFQFLAFFQSDNFFYLKKKKKQDYTTISTPPGWFLCCLCLQFEIDGYPRSLSAHSKQLSTWVLITYFFICLSNNCPHLALDYKTKKKKKKEKCNLFGLYNSCLSQWMACYVPNKCLWSKCVKEWASKNSLTCRKENRKSVKLLRKTVIGYMCQQTKICQR